MPPDANVYQHVPITAVKRVAVSSNNGIRELVSAVVLKSKPVERVNSGIQISVSVKLLTLVLNLLKTALCLNGMLLTVNAYKSVKFLLFPVMHPPSLIIEAVLASVHKLNLAPLASNGTLNLASAHKEINALSRKKSAFKLLFIKMKTGGMMLIVNAFILVILSVILKPSAQPTNTGI